MWRRIQPTLRIADPRKSELVHAIHRTLRRASADERVFYGDEAGIDLSPRIELAWMPRGELMTVPMPGKKLKHYVPGSLSARIGAAVSIGHAAKNSELLLQLVEVVLRTYRRALCLRLIFLPMSFTRPG